MKLLQTKPMKLTSTIHQKTLLLFSFFALISFQLKSQSLLGAEIWYNYDNVKGLELRLTTYSYCDGSSIPSAELAVNDSRKLQYVNLSLVSSDDVTPLCTGLESRCVNPNSVFPYGIRKIVYKGKLDATALSHCEVNISWQGGKRATSITNLEAGQDLFIEANFSFCNSATNRGPVLEFLPITNIYTELGASLYQTAKNENDDDSLSYELIAPKRAKNQNVIYNNSFNENQPFGVNNTLSYDNNTGLVTVNAYTEGVNAAAYKIIKWSKDDKGNWYKKAEIVRDAATIITKKSGQQKPQLTGMNGGAIFREGEFPPGKPAHYGNRCFTINSFDPDIIDSLTISWNQGMSEVATFIIEKNKIHPRSQLCYNTQNQKPGTINYYSCIVSATDNNYPIRNTVQRKFEFIHTSHEDLVEWENKYICLGDSVQLKATGGRDHQWCKGEWHITKVLNDSIVVPLKDSFYTVMGRDRVLGCSLYDKINIYVCEECVWPGETNIDGLVDMKDILPIGVAYNTEGIRRPYESTVWKSHYSLDWNTNLTFAINNKHVDCDGDSVIQKTDADVVIKNYTQNPDNSKRFLNGRNTDPELGLVFHKSYYLAGETVTADLILGTPVNLAKDMYGLALRFGFNPDFIEPGSFKMETEKSWLLSKNDDLILMKEFPEKGIVDLGLCRINHLSADGNGNIATIQFKLKNNITGKQALQLQLLDAQVINAKYEEKTFQLGLAKKTTYIYQDKLEHGMDSVPGSADIRIIQNPQENTLTIVDKTETINHIRLTNARGQVILEQVPLRQNRHVLKITNLSSGVYFISVVENGEAKTKAFTITK